MSVGIAATSAVVEGRDFASVVSQARQSQRARSVAVSSALAVAIVVLLCVSVSVGDFPISLHDVVPAVFGFGEPNVGFVVRTLRLPRALAAVLVGAAFGLSGLIFQSLARNPLASPDVIGITTGASAAAVTIIVLSGTTSAMVALGALGGALATALVLYLLAYRNGLSAYRLVLVGIGVDAVLRAVTSYLLTRAKVFEAQRAMVWLAGSLNGRSWTQVKLLGAAMLLLVPAVLVLLRPLRAIQLGDDTAQALGVRVERSRAALTLVAVVLAAVATATAGPIAFVAFVAAPIARRLVRAPLMLVPAALTGALVLLLSDLIARRVFAPTELPVGVVTGVIGAPYLLWLLAHANRTGSGG